jgi:glycine betaine/proline transport system permease protein
MEWFTKFPTMDSGSLRDLKKVIDEGFRAFTRAYGDSIETIFVPLQHFLIWSERFMTRTPWPIIILLIAAVAWFASRNWKIVAGAVGTLLVIGYFDMWDDTMKTVSMIFVCTVLSIVIGIPIGILMARSDRLQNHQPDPRRDADDAELRLSHPVVMIFGIGKVPGLIAVVIYAVPPMIRLTNLGIRLVDKEVLEAADAFGSSGWQKLKNVQMPLALPTIMAGINQTIMMSLAMVVVASMVGVRRSRQERAAGH